MSQRKRNDIQGERAKQLREALRPLAEKGVTRQQAHDLVWTSVQSMRQGNSVDHLLPGILNELFERSPIDLNNDMRACQKKVYDALVEAMRFRNLDNMEWISHERQRVADVASHWAKQNHYPHGVTVEDVKRIETSAVGHIDYASKLALYVAEFVVMPQPTRKDPQ